MAYQALGTKKLNKLRSETKLDIERAIVRGGENHTIRLNLTDGTTILYNKGVLSPSQFTNFLGEVPNEPRY